jgi:hypothetical protein
MILCAGYYLYHGKKSMANVRKNEDLESFDEIDIDSILNESIGTTGKPTVPSAFEPLPSLMDEDVVDIETLLAELNADAIESAPDPKEEKALEALFEHHLAEGEEPKRASLPESMPVLEEIDVDFDLTLPVLKETVLSQEEEHSLSAPFLDPEPALDKEANNEHSIEESALLDTMYSTEVASGTEELEPEPVLRDSLSEPISTRMGLSQLLVHESEPPRLGTLPIPEIPQEISWKFKRSFWAKLNPWRWTVLQQRAACYGLGIVLWLGLVGHMYYHTIQQQETAIESARLAEQRRRMQQIAAEKKARLLREKQLALLAANKPKAKVSSALTKPETKHGEVSGELEQKDGVEGFEPVQCNLLMDSKTLKEDLFRCLRMAKVID